MDIKKLNKKISQKENEILKLDEKRDLAQMELKQLLDAKKRFEKLENERLKLEKELEGTFKTNTKKRKNTPSNESNTYYDENKQGEENNEY